MKIDILNSTISDDEGNSIKLPHMEIGEITPNVTSTSTVGFGLENTYSRLTHMISIKIPVNILEFEVDDI